MKPEAHSTRGLLLDLKADIFSASSPEIDVREVRNEWIYTFQSFITNIVITCSVFSFTFTFTIQMTSLCDREKEEYPGRRS